MTISLKAAVCATLIAGSASAGFASENPTTYLEQAQALAHKAGSGLKLAGNVVLQKGADVSGWAQDKATDLYGYASDKAVFGYNWAAGVTPEPVKAFMANHPYFTTAAIVAPLALLIGYKIGKARSAETKPADQDKK